MNYLWQSTNFTNWHEPVDNTKQTKTKTIDYKVIGYVSSQVKIEEPLNTYSFKIKLVEVIALCIDMR